eukprot:1797024-Pyramimonas_sp.AAC.1
MTTFFDHGMRRKGVADPTMGHSSRRRRLRRGTSEATSPLCNICYQRHVKRREFSMGENSGVRAKC